MKRKLIIMTIAIAFPVLLLSFQNCGQVGKGQVLSQSGGDNEDLVEAFPFALTSTPKPQPEPNAPPISPVMPMIGDLNHDNTVDESDFKLLHQFVYFRPTLSAATEPVEPEFPFGKEDFLMRADTNGDGYVTCYDLYAIHDVMRQELSPDDLPILYGDANQDGVVNDADLALLEMFLSGEMRPAFPVTLLNVARRDLNRESEINDVDYAVLGRLIEAKETLDPSTLMLSAPAMMGDVNLDCRVSVHDMTVVIREVQGQGATANPNFLAPKFWGDVDFSSSVKEPEINIFDVEKIKTAFQKELELPFTEEFAGPNGKCVRRRACIRR